MYGYQGLYSWGTNTSPDFFFTLVRLCPTVLHGEVPTYKDNAMQGVEAQYSIPIYLSYGS